MPSFRKRLKNFTNKTPAAVAITKDNAPKINIYTDVSCRNLSACVEAPTVRPIRMVMTSMSGPLAVSARRLVTPLSFNKFPKNSIPRSGRPEGTIKQVKRKPIIGKSIFSV